MRLSAALLTAGPLALCAFAHAQKPNVLLVVADDIGNDRVGAYAEHPDPGHTPTLDALAAQGILFRNAYANPICSPTRATILTGRYCFRTGVGGNVLIDSDAATLSFDEVTIPELLPAAYSNAAVGKWHLGYGALHPNLSGFDRFTGSLHNLDRLDGIASYYRWSKLTDGLLQISETYATTDTADETVCLAQSLPEPWFIYCAFNAPHDPYEAPPDPLHTYDLQGDPLDSIPLHKRAMIEAMDSELARILAALPTNTVVIFVGDNGTEGQGTDPPTVPGHAKGTVYEGGVNVPLIVAGPGVAQGECAALVNTTDLFATVIELAGGWSEAEDSVSIVPYLSDPSLPSLRETVFFEKFAKNNSLRGMRDERYKLIRAAGQGIHEEFYDLAFDPDEQEDLLPLGLTPEEEEAYQRLRTSMPPLLEWQLDCPQPPNSTGLAALLTGSGSAELEAGALRLTASAMPPEVLGAFLVGQGDQPIFQLGQPGSLCLGGQAWAVFPPQVSDPSGAFERFPDLAALPFAPVRAVQAGETWRFQAWYRDGVVNGYPATSFTQALQTSF